ncbi:hypothetical protein BOTBODRAFT_47000 [Botryobasidium botryosum FD-172 SS1]|uniref:Uncharacterized protein n=1 Tax=Botryobasidium botryosum (strain FD-172 SS1) TaxID=930990 RepID=A0A067M3X4_BOTB1|nr:hypothetical protein BOTBODRAFT_47000 [Botryobasidium botryosum FD-172 SS1]
MSTQSQSHNDPTAHSIYKRFSAYDFASDETFQQGLSPIIRPVQEAGGSVDENIIGRAKAFYFSKVTGQEISWDGYLAWRETNGLGAQQRSVPPSAAHSTHELEPKTADPSNSTGSVGMDDAPLPMSFTAIAQLINTGNLHLIPNNKLIPDGLNSQEPSKPQQKAPRKLWETAIDTSAV